MDYGELFLKYTHNSEYPTHPPWVVLPLANYFKIQQFDITMSGIFNAQGCLSLIWCPLETSQEHLPHSNLGRATRIGSFSSSVGTLQTVCTWFVIWKWIICIDIGSRRDIFLELDMQFCLLLLLVIKFVPISIAMMTVSNSFLIGEIILNHSRRPTCWGGCWLLLTIHVSKTAPEYMLTPRCQYDNFLSALQLTCCVMKKKTYYLN